MMVNDVVKEYLISLGYNNEDIENILACNSLKSFKEDTLLIHIKDIYNLLISLGYSREDVIKMTKTFPALYGYSIENIKQKIDDLISLGYSRADVIKMTKTFPALYALSIENIKQKIEDLISLGYSRADVIKMTKLLPALYSYSIENIKQKIEDLISLGYSHENVIKMTKSLPSLYSYSIENIKQKIIFLREIQLDFIAIEDTKQLMQSIDLTYARYMFFKDKGIEVTRDNYRRLFYDAKQFEKQYGIDKSSLLEQYNYQEYLNSKNNINTL